MTYLGYKEMRKVFFVIGMMIVMVGCNNPLKKSISEELTMEEVKSISKKDPLFLAFYDRYFENKCCEGFLKDKTAQVLYSDITYKRFYKYIKQVNDDDFINAIYEDAEKEWDERFGYTEQKFDSIINYWQCYLQENAPNTYLDIEFDHAVAYNTYSRKSIQLYFKLIPKKGKLRSACFWYTIKDDNTVTSGIAYQTQAFSNPVVIADRPTWDIDTQSAFYKDAVVTRLSNEELKEKYSFIFAIDNVKTDEDVCISMDKLYQDMPVEIELYIKESRGELGMSANVENLLNKDKVEIIKRYIDEDYVSLDEYKTTLQNIRMNETDPLSYNFHVFIVDCKNALK